MLFRSAPLAGEIKVGFDGVLVAQHLYLPFTIISPPSHVLQGIQFPVAPYVPQLQLPPAPSAIGVQLPFGGLYCPGGQGVESQDGP